MLNIFKIKNCLWSQIEESSILFFRFKSDCIGFALKNALKDKRINKFSPFPIRFTFVQHTGQMDMVKIFDIGCRWLRVWYKTKGEVTLDSHRWGEQGLHLKILNKLIF